MFLSADSPQAVKDATVRKTNKSRFPIIFSNASNRVRTIRIISELILNKTQSEIPDRMYGIVADDPQIPEITTCELKADQSQECDKKLRITKVQ